MSLVELWWRAWIVTVAVESLLAHALLSRAEPDPVRRLASCVLVNLATHPVVWFVIPEMDLSAGPALVIAELFAIGVETAGYRLILRELSWRRALLVGLVLNVASLGAGRALRALGAPV